MSDIQEKTRRFLIQVYKLTLAEKLQWVMAFSPNSVQTDIGEMTVSIDPYIDQFDNEKLVILVRSRFGTLFDRIDENTLPTGNVPLIDVDSYEELLDKLYSLAFRQASGASRALDEMLGLLDDADANDDSTKSNS